MANIYGRVLERIDADPRAALRERVALGSKEKAWVAARACSAGGRERPGARSSRVLVIGGGVAGITCALDCAESGAQVTLVEVRRRLGGAAYSFERDGLALDNGQHVFLRCCHAYRGLLARLGSKRAGPPPGQGSRSRFCSPGHEPTLLRRGSLPAPTSPRGRVCSRYRPPDARSERLWLRRARRRARSRSTPTLRSSKDVSFGAWLRAHGQGQRGARETVGSDRAADAQRSGPMRPRRRWAAFVFRTGLLRSTATRATSAFTSAR